MVLLLSLALENKKMNIPLSKDLKLAGAILADEIRKGIWDDIIDRSQPVTKSEKLISELEERISGYTKEEYQSAISHGLFVTR